MDGQTNVHTDRHTDGRMYGRGTEEQTYRQRNNLQKPLNTFLHKICMRKRNSCTFNVTYIIEFCIVFFLIMLAIPRTEVES